MWLTLLAIDYRPLLCRAKCDEEIMVESAAWRLRIGNTLVRYSYKVLLQATLTSYSYKVLLQGTLTRYSYKLLL